MRSKITVFLITLCANVAPLFFSQAGAADRVLDSLPFLQILLSYAAIELLLYFLVLTVLAIIQVQFSRAIFRFSFGPALSERERFQGTLLTSLLISLLLYFGNAMLLVNSSIHLSGIQLWGLGGFLFLSFSWLLLSFLRRNPFKLMAITVGAVMSIIIVRQEPHLDATDNTMANVFIFGVDGLRPDVLESYPHIAPSLSQFVSSSIQYSNAYTPLGRTHTSLTALLASQYPMHSGVNFNLIDSPTLDAQTLLPNLFRQQGHQTILGLNERRFSSIHEDYGFEQIVGPKAGIADFLMSGLSDIPVVNILSQFEFSKYVFPYVRSNRALMHSYQPEHFINDIKFQLNASSSVSPVFSLIHFTEPHYPYWPVDKNNDALMNMTEESGNFRRYLQAVQVVDRSFNQLMSELNESGYLDNAVVILLSDHGESFEQDQWRFSGAQDSTHIEKGYGHGTTVAALEQSHIVLAMQQYKDGVSITEPKVISDLVSVVDVYPTLLSIAGYDIPAGIDGVNLLTIENRSENIGLKEKRTIPIETGFYAPALMNDVLNEWEVFMESFNAFEISTVGRVVLKREKALELIPSKELAVFDGDNMLVFPREHKGQFAPPILYNTKELTYRVASKEEDGEIVSAFCGYYWNQYLRTDVDNWCSDRTTR